MSIIMVEDLLKLRSEVATRLRERISERTWEQRVKVAKQRLECLEAVRCKRDETGISWLRCLREVSPDVTWSQYQHWRRKLRTRKGSDWERLLDYRTPPSRPSVPEHVRAMARSLRQINPDLDCETARIHLIGVFGEDGAISDTTLRRIWSAAGLAKTQQPPSRENVQSFHGGGGLALIGAAAVETGVPLALAKAILAAGLSNVSDCQPNDSQTSPLSIPEKRDAKGCFTAEYNHTIRKGLNPGDKDPRLATDEAKRAQRDLTNLNILKQRPETLAHKLLCMGMTPLLTERRGFVGLAGPQGEWLAVLGGTPYMPATLDKGLTELALLKANSTLWAAHGQNWALISRMWSQGGPPWLQLLLYVDATQDPYWTRDYAASAKVSRIAKVMPALTRVAVMAGPGVPLLMVTMAGAVSLKSELIPTLERLEETVGKGEVGRITIVDAEIATAQASILALAGMKDRYFVTVLKGSMAKLANKESSDWQEWSDYRDQDKIREGKLLLTGEGAPEDGLRLRLVEMRREGRQPSSTIFASTAPEEDLGTADIPNAYLSRWPHQEQYFRDARNGGGLNRTQGYGGEFITHAAIEKEQEKAEKRVTRAQTAMAKEEAHLEAANDLKESVHAELKASRKNLTATRKAHHASNTESAELTQALVTREEKEQRFKAAQYALKSASKAVRTAKKKLEKAEIELDKNKTTPRVIYSRDTTREDIGTVLKATLLMLVQYVIKEFFPQGARMEWRTFIELFVYLPVTVKSSSKQIVYQIQANMREPARIAQLQHACKEINRRKIYKKGKLLRFSVTEP
jgi:hypothetical protein